MEQGPINVHDPPPERRRTSWKKDVRLAVLIIGAIGALVGLAILVGHL